MRLYISFNVNFKEYPKKIQSSIPLPSLPPTNDTLGPQRIFTVYKFSNLLVQKIDKRPSFLY